MFVKKMMPRSMRGFTLTEAAIVLGIVGLILGAIWVAAAAVYNNLRVSTASNQLLQIVQSVRSIHATQNTVDTGLAGTAGAVLIARAGGIPKDMLNDPTNPTEVRNGWNGQVQLASATSAGVAGDSFTITFPSVPQGACSDLLTRNTGAGRDTGIVSAGANGTTYTQAGGDFPVTVTNAVAACSVTGAAGNSMTFTFMLKS